MRKKLQLSLILVFTIAISLGGAYYHYYNAQRLQAGDIIYMMNEDNEMEHVVIYQPDAKKRNIIGCVLSGVAYRNLQKELKRRKKWHAEIFRYNPKGVSIKRIKMVRKAIGDQAKRWHACMAEQHQRNFYNYSTFYLRIVLAEKMDAKSMKAMGYTEKALNTFAIWKKTFYDLTTGPDRNAINTLFYLKYAIRQQTLPTLNKGFTCQSFVLACVGTALLKELVEPYCVQDKHWKNQATTLLYWPTLRYKIANKQMKDFSPIYRKVVRLLHQENLPYDRQKFQKFLQLKYKGFTPERSGPHIKDNVDKIHCKKISLSRFLMARGTTESVVRKRAETLLGSLAEINPKYANSKDCYNYFMRKKGTWQHIAY